MSNGPDSSFVVLLSIEPFGNSLLLSSVFGCKTDGLSGFWIFKFSFSLPLTSFSFMIQKSCFLSHSRFWLFSTVCFSAKECHCRSQSHLTNKSSRKIKKIKQISGIGSCVFTLSSPPLPTHPLFHKVWICICLKNWVHEKNVVGFLQSKCGINELEVYIWVMFQCGINKLVYIWVMFQCGMS